MRTISYNEESTGYSAGKSFEEAQRRGDEQGYAENPQDAWNALDYWEREEDPDSNEVFRFVTSIQVTKVEPPYTPRS